MIPTTPRPTDQLDNLQTFTETTDKVTVGEVIDALGANSFAIAILIISLLLIILAFVPGMFIILGLPMTILAAQWAFGVEHIWLPAKLRDRTMPADKVQKGLGIAMRWLSYLHPLIHPRGRILRLTPFRRFARFVLLFLCFFIFLPIPLGNIPPAIAIACIAAAEMEDDGYLMAIGTVFGLLVAGGFITITLFVLEGAL